MRYLLVLLFLIVFPGHAFASSSYVLPYPGIMPGNKLYKPYEILQQLQGYISFGDFASFKYNLEQSDRYLVEAKTLFEYKQYPLALRALEKSDHYFMKVYPNLMSAKENGKDIREKINLYNQAKLKHIEVLQELKKDVPKNFVWQDEKKDPISLGLWKELDQAISTRNEK